MENTKIDFKNIADTVVEYDKNGAERYPENEFEGLSFFMFLYKKITGNILSKDDFEKIFKYDNYDRYTEPRIW